MKWFNNISVMVKLLFGFIFVALLAGLVGYIGVRNIRTIDNADTFLYEKTTLPLQYLGEYVDSIGKMQIDSRDIIRSTDDTYVAKKKEDISKRKKRVEDLFKLYEKTFIDENDVKLYHNLVNATNDYYKVLDQVFVFDDRKQDKEAYQLMDGAGAATVAKLDEVLQEVTDGNVKSAKDTSDGNMATADRAVLTMEITVSAAILIAILFGLFISMSIKRPIAKGLAFAQKIAAGDFTDRIDMDQKDELGQLGKALNTAADDLEQMVAGIIVSSQNLVQAIQEISAGNENLSQRTSEQASSLEEVASTIEETTASINQNAENAKNANDLAAKTSESAEEGGRVVYGAVDAINEINEASKKIEEIISVINDISFQTNLLALNAAVEAARAGEQGRGFAVVAGEVRNLAQRSGAAAKEIGTLIKSTIQKVDKGTNLANKSGEALKGIIIAVKNVGNLVSEINAASEEQKQGASQINIAISELDSMTQQNAGLVEETAAASEEIANQAQELLATMEKFKIRDQMRVQSQGAKHKDLHLHSAEKGKLAVKSDRKGVTSVSGAVPKNQKEIDKILSQDGFEQF